MGTVSYFILESLEPGMVLSPGKKKNRRNTRSMEWNGIEFPSPSLPQSSLGTYHQSPRLF